jgi:hypothetical protein
VSGLVLFLIIDECPYCHRFQYEAEVLKELMFPRPKLNLANRDATTTTTMESGVESGSMVVDGEEFGDTKDVPTASKIEQEPTTHVPISSTSAPSFRPLVLENGVEGFLVESRPPICSCGELGSTQSYPEGLRAEAAERGVDGNGSGTKTRHPSALVMQ